MIDRLTFSRVIAHPTVHCLCRSNSLHASRPLVVEGPTSPFQRTSPSIGWWASCPCALHIGGGIESRSWSSP
jgi:hypothetical protein